MRKEVLAEGVELYCGDMLQILPQLPEKGHILCDPPYEEELHAAFGSIRQIRTDGKKQSRHSELDFEAVNTDRGIFAKALVDATEGWLLVFALAEGIRAWRDDIQASGGKWHGTLFWVKPDAAPRFNGQGPARGAECAALAWCGGGHRSWNSGGKRGVYTHCVNVGRQGEHPTEKPIPLMAELVLDYTKPNDLIVDPFCGSGATGIAAVKAGRRFIGIDQSEKWFDLSRRRIEHELKQPDMFIHRPTKAVQEALF